jgi:starch-binding outer membrane protein, SusD/RagB family
MKQYKYIAILAMLVTAIGSCSKDFVSLSPEAQINGVNFYKTTTDFQEAVIGAYAPLRDAAAYAWYCEEMRGDNTKYDRNADRGGAGYEQIADFMEDASNGVPGNVWIADYKGIQRTNVILDRIQKIGSAIADADKNQIIGEAKALRAHYYFELVRLFGKLPLYLHEVTDNSSAVVTYRSSVDSVYIQIISDFTDALSRLAVPAFSASTVGRVNKGMVATELGLVYLTRQDYTDAATILQTVTAMGYSLYPNYADIFDPKNKSTSKESIFEVQYKSGTDGQASSFIYSFIPTTTNTTGILGVKYKITSGGWNYPTDDLINSYEPGDLRLDASIAISKGHYDGTGAYIPDSVVSILNPPTPGETSKRFLRKYYHLPYALQNNTDDNWPWYRYADVLLMLAEALNEQGQPGNALPYLNQVRARAGLAASTVTDQTGLRAVIAHERRIELAFENHRWFDLVRTNQAIPVMNAFGIIQKATYGYLSPNSYNVTQDRMIYAIPFRETQVNPLFGQNHGY